MSRYWRGVAPGARSTRRKWTPASTGESTSDVSEVGANWMSPAFSRCAGSAVPYFQPAGSLTLARKLMSSVWRPAG